MSILSLGFTRGPRSSASSSTFKVYLFGYILPSNALKTRIRIEGCNDLATSFMYLFCIGCFARQRHKFDKDQYTDGILNESPPITNFHRFHLPQAPEHLPTSLSQLAQVLETPYLHTTAIHMLVCLRMISKIDTLQAGFDICHSIAFCSCYPGFPIPLPLSIMSTRAIYHGSRRKLVLAFDVGTAYSGISYRYEYLQDFVSQ